jgi:DNA helicase-2/ATP-dependent DNA helicase PcrA
MRDVQLVLGPPGTGKTETLLRMVHHDLEHGVAPERLAFVSFSRRAIREAVNRVARGDLPYFKTIHATAFKLAELTRSDVLGPVHLHQFGAAMGEAFSAAAPRVDPTDDGTAPPIYDVDEGTFADRVLSLLGLAAARETSLYHEWDTAQLPDLEWEYVERLAADYATFKQRNALTDFSDMIADTGGTLDVDVLYLDEAQDTSTAQWSLLRRILPADCRLIIAGDDDQAVYHWSGADVDFLQRVRGERRVLPVSFRLPRSIKRLADGVTARMHQRTPKVYAPRDAEGVVEWVTGTEYVDVREGEWLLLARTNAQLAGWRAMARQQGVVYQLPDGRWSWALPAVRAAMAYFHLQRGNGVPRAEVRTLLPFLPHGVRTDIAVEYLPELCAWEHVLAPGFDRATQWYDACEHMNPDDMLYIRELRQRGESLTKPGRVRISTVHGAKGAQADHVALLTDITQRVEAGAQREPDAELRVQYVGVTRARERLVLVSPVSERAWRF